jgi:hypothetical protein
MDDPGKDLEPDADIWRLYGKDAEKYDQYLVKGLHEQMDVILLFVRFVYSLLVPNAFPLTRQVTVCTSLGSSRRVPY